MKQEAKRTKVVCTIGPASEGVEVLQAMIRAGMDVARLNFSHGDPDSHRRVIGNLRDAAHRTGRRVAILGDLPGPKMRIGQIAPEPVELKSDEPFTLTTKECIGDATKASISFAALPRAVKPGDTLFLNDGFIQLEVMSVSGEEVRCRVMVGGELRSKKGLNLPGIDLGISAFTENDRKWLSFAIGEGLDAVSQSFVESEKDITAVRAAIDACLAGKANAVRPLIFAKIERSRTLGRIDPILQAADGIMIARGDLGVEIPIEEIAIVQKRLAYKGNLLGKPVITATQMLESMTENRRPTRAEATDVANAILDGTDCVMLSGESAMGKYPVDAAAMLGRIATAIEPLHPGASVREYLKAHDPAGTTSLMDLISLSIETALERIAPVAVFVPTLSGATARSIARFRPAVPVVAMSPHETTCRRLQFTWGVHPEHVPERPKNWNIWVRDWLKAHGISGSVALLTEGPSADNPSANNRMEVIEIGRIGA